MVGERKRSIGVVMGLDCGLWDLRPDPFGLWSLRFGAHFVFSDEKETVFWIEDKNN